MAACPGRQQGRVGAERPGAGSSGRAGEMPQLMLVCTVQGSRRGAAVPQLLPSLTPGQLRADTVCVSYKPGGGGSGDALSGVQLTGVMGRGAAWGRHGHSTHAHAQITTQRA